MTSVTQFFFLVNWFAALANPLHRLEPMHTPVYFFILAQFYPKSYALATTYLHAQMCHRMPTPALIASLPIRFIYFVRLCDLCPDERV